MIYKALYRALVTLSKCVVCFLSISYIDEENQYIRSEQHIWKPFFKSYEQVNSFWRLFTFLLRSTWYMEQFFIELGHIDPTFKKTTDSRSCKWMIYQLNTTRNVTRINEGRSLLISLKYLEFENLGSIYIAFYMVNMKRCGGVCIVCKIFGQITSYRLIHDEILKCVVFVILSESKSIRHDKLSRTRRIDRIFPYLNWSDS